MFYNFYPQIVPFMGYVGKYCRVGQATDDNMACGLCMLDTQGYKHIIRLCKRLLFSHYTNGYTKVPQYCVVPILAVLLSSNVERLIYLSMAARITSKFCM